MVSDISARDLARHWSHVVQQRGFAAVIWAMPAVNYELMRYAARSLGSRDNQIVYWSTLLDWKNQTLTPNPDAIYLMPFINTSGGPVVLEIPPAEGGSITGTAMDAWQVPLEDVGPAGVDEGRGGKYVYLPPGYGDRLPADCIALPSETFGGYALLRSNLAGGTEQDLATALDYARRIMVYPLSAIADPPPTTYHDAAGALFDSTIPYHSGFFDSLNRFVQDEPWLSRDKAMIDVLSTLGIAKGTTFTPDVDTREILDSAAQQAKAWTDALYEAFFAQPYFPGTQWALPASTQLVQSTATHYADPDSYPLDARAAAYAWAFSSVKHLGAGQFYLMSTRDNTGHVLDGSHTYRLTVPPHVPVRLYWSATAYDRDTHALIREQPWSSRSSHTTGLQTNTDGSVTLAFGPAEPAAGSGNWIPTAPGRPFEILMRFFGPEKAFVDKTWHLPDIELTE